MSSERSVRDLVGPYNWRIGGAGGSYPCECCARSRTESEFQCGSGFAARRGILPCLQGLLDGQHKHRVAAEDFDLLDVSIRSDRDLYLDHTSKRELSRRFGIRRGRMRNQLPAFLCWKRCG